MKLTFVHFCIKFITWKMKSIFTLLIEVLLLCHWMLKSLFIVEYFIEFHFLLKSTNFVHYMFILHFLYSNLICLNEHFMRSKYLFVSNISTFSSVFFICLCKKKKKEYRFYFCFLNLKLSFCSELFSAEK